MLVLPLSVAPTCPASCHPLPFQENTCPVFGFRSAAELLLASDPRTNSFEAELDTRYLRAALAYARDDRTALSRIVSELADWIAARDIGLQAATPDRLLAAYARREPLALLPRLIWCCGDPDL